MPFRVVQILISTTTVLINWYDKETEKLSAAVKKVQPDFLNANMLAPTAMLIHYDNVRCFLT